MDTDLRTRAATARRLAAEIGTPNLRRALLASARELDRRCAGGGAPAEGMVVRLSERAPRQT